MAPVEVLWADALEHLKEVREGSVEERKPEMDRETMTRRRPNPPNGGTRMQQL